MYRYSYIYIINNTMYTYVTIYCYINYNTFTTIIHATNTYTIVLARYVITPLIVDIPEVRTTSVTREHAYLEYLITYVFTFDDIIELRNNARPPARRLRNGTPRPLMVM